MGIIVNSPFSGRPVKIRDQDVGRAVRDEENRIFYALPKANGSGYYGAPTRAGGPKDEQRAAEMDARQAQAKQSGHEQSTQQIHDASGKRRGGKLKLVATLILLALLGSAAYVYVIAPDADTPLHNAVDKITGK